MEELEKLRASLEIEQGKTAGQKVEIEKWKRHARAEEDKNKKLNEESRRREWTIKGQAKAIEEEKQAVAAGEKRIREMNEALRKKSEMLQSSCQEFQKLKEERDRLKADAQKSEEAKQQLRSHVEVREKNFCHMSALSSWVGINGSMSFYAYLIPEPEEAPRRGAAAGRFSQVEAVGAEAGGAAAGEGVWGEGAATGEGGELRR